MIPAPGFVLGKPIVQRDHYVVDTKSKTIVWVIRRGLITIVCVYLSEKK